MIIQDETDRFLRNYGGGLGKLEKESLYNILQFSKKHTQAVGQAVRRVPFHAVLMSLLLEQQKRLSLLTDQVAAMDQEIGGHSFQ
jgi:hypothetical protein